MVLGSTQILATRQKFSRSLLPAFLPHVAHLHQELAVLGELQDLGVFLAVAADPHVAFVVDVDAVIRFRPLVALPRSAPVPDQVARLIELKDRRGRTAALGDGRLEFEPSFVVVQPARAAMNDPDVVLLIDPHADGPAEQPVIRQRLRPQRIDFEHRRLDGASLRVRLILQHATGRRRARR